MPCLSRGCADDALGIFYFAFNCVSIVLRRELVHWQPFARLWQHWSIVADYGTWKRLRRDISPMGPLTS
jgi:hypothetical protein